jgi:excisionase family DNA binding protein
MSEQPINGGRPFSPETLADRWECSARQIRKMLTAGDLNGFRLGGKLWRIPAAEVERVECPGDGDSSDTGAHSAPISEKASSLSVARSVRQTAP